MPARGRNRPGPELWHRAGRWFTYDEVTGAYLAHITFDEFPVVRRTPEGVWLRIAHHGMRNGIPIEPDDKYNLKWVSTSAMKRFAYPTKSMALTSLRRRAQSYVRHCNTRVAQANATVQALHTYELDEANVPSDHRFVFPPTFHNPITHDEEQVRGPSMINVIMNEHATIAHEAWDALPYRPSTNPPVPTLGFDDDQDLAAGAPVLRVDIPREPE